MQRIDEATRPLTFGVNRSPIEQRIVDASANVARVLRLPDGGLVGDLSREPTDVDQRAYDQLFQLAQNPTAFNVNQIVRRFYPAKSSDETVYRTPNVEKRQYSAASHIGGKLSILAGSKKTIADRGEFSVDENARYSLLLKHQLSLLAEEELECRAERFENWSERGVFVDGWRLPAPPHTEKDAPSVVSVLGVISLGLGHTALVTDDLDTPLSVDEVRIMDILAKRELSLAKERFEPSEVQTLHEFGRVLAFVKTSLRKRGGNETLSEIMQPIFATVISGDYASAVKDLMIASYRYAEMFSTVSRNVDRLQATHLPHDPKLERRLSSEGKSWTMKERSMFSRIRTSAQERWDNGQLETGAEDEADDELNEEFMRKIGLSPLITLWHSSGNVGLFEGIGKYSDKGKWPAIYYKLDRLAGGGLQPRSFHVTRNARNIDSSNLAACFRHGKVEFLPYHLERFVKRQAPILGESLTEFMAYLDSSAERLKKAADDYVEHAVNTARNLYLSTGVVPGYLFNVPELREVNPDNFESLLQPKNIDRLRAEAAEIKKQQEQYQRIEPILTRIQELGIEGVETFDGVVEDKDAKEVLAYLEHPEVEDYIRAAQQEYTISQNQIIIAANEVLRHNRTDLVMMWLKDQKTIKKIKPSDVHDDELEPYALKSTGLRPIVKPRFSLSGLRNTFRQTDVAVKVDYEMWDD